MRASREHAPQIQLKLQAVQAFVAVVDHGSFKAAADHLCFEPTRLRRLVRALERDLAVTLLRVTTRQCDLTPDGKALLKQCRSLLAQASALTMQARTRAHRSSA